MLTRSRSAFLRDYYSEQVKSVVESLVHKVATQTRVTWHKAGITKAYTYEVDDGKRLKPSPLTRIKKKDKGKATPFILPQELPIMKPLPTVLPSYPKIVVQSYPILDHPLVQCQLPHARPVPQDRPMTLSEIYELARKQDRIHPRDIG